MSFISSASFNAKAVFPTAVGPSITGIVLIKIYLFVSVYITTRNLKLKSFVINLLNVF
ncbi:MAG: hypothetical protein WAT89_03555 [Candidatus Kapaibacterium sp.]